MLFRAWRSSAIENRISRPLQVQISHSLQYALSRIQSFYRFPIPIMLWKSGRKIETVGRTLNS